MDPLEAILKNARAGDLDAKTQVVRLHHRMVRSYIAALVADPASVDDLAQESFIRALDRLDRVPSTTQLPAFLRGIARNVAREHFRRNRTDTERAERYLRHVETELEAQPSPWLSEDPQLLVALRSCISKLSASSQNLLHLRYQSEQNASEMSRELDQSPGSIRVALTRIRKQLSACIRQQHPEWTQRL